MQPKTDLPIHITKIERTGIACPSQWDAWTEDGQYVYIRYRWGNFSITTCDNEDSYFIDGRCVEICNWEGGDAMDGFMTNDEMVERSAGILTFADGVVGPELEWTIDTSLLGQFVQKEEGA